MNTEELRRRLAYLEFVNDQLLSEVTYVDELLRGIGFPNGLESAKHVAHDLLEERIEQEEEC